jgi:hypothetical protein
MPGNRKEKPRMEWSLLAILVSFGTNERVLAPSVAKAQKAPTEMIP